MELSKPYAALLGISGIISAWKCNAYGKSRFSDKIGWIISYPKTSLDNLPKIISDNGIRLVIYHNAFASSGLTEAIKKGGARSLCFTDGSGINKLDGSCPHFKTLGRIFNSDCDFVLTRSLLCYRHFRSLHPTKVCYVPFVDSNWNGELFEDISENTFEYDISFSGQLDCKSHHKPPRADFIKALISRLPYRKFVVSGVDAKKYFPNDSDNLVVLQGGMGAIPLAATYGKSKISFCPPYILGRWPYYLLGRDFEPQRFGCLYLRGRNLGVEEMWKFGEEIIEFSDLDSLVEKIEYYLNHDEERLEIASKALKRTHNQYHPHEWWSKMFSFVEHQL